MARQAISPMQKSYRKLLLIPLAAIGYRLRGSAGEGGWFEKLFGFAIGTFLGRFLWCVPVSYMFAETWLEFAAYLALTYGGVMFGYWGGQFDLEKEENRNWKNYAILSLRGAFIAFPLALATGAWGGVIAGSILPFYYRLGMSIAPRLKLPLLHGFSEWGELMLGLAIAVGLCL